VNGPLLDLLVILKFMFLIKHLKIHVLKFMFKMHVFKHLQFRLMKYGLIVYLYLNLFYLQNVRKVLHTSGKI
jgi:hypothetical protein